MQIKNPTKKTLKVLYLYMTVPLLLVAVVTGSVWFLAAGEAKDEAASKPVAAKAADSDTEDVTIEHLHEHCTVKDDCGIGESCLDSHCVNLLKNPPERPPEVKAPEEGMGATGWAAIIAALLGGLTALLGAITQTIMAFIKAKERRRGA
jgi:hypothetical protein